MHHSAYDEPWDPLEVGTVRIGCDWLVLDDQDADVLTGLDVVLAHGVTVSMAKGSRMVKTAPTNPEVPVASPADADAPCAAFPYAAFPTWLTSTVP
jgi:hypothetical protein